MATRDNGRRPKRRKRSRVRKVLWLILLLWLLSLSLSLFGAFILYNKIDRLEMTNARMAVQLAAVQQRAQTTATNEELQQTRRHVDQLERRLEELLVSQREREFQFKSGIQVAGPTPLETKEPAIALNGTSDTNGEASTKGRDSGATIQKAAWYAALASGAAYYGSQILRAVVSVARLHPAIP